MSKRRQSARPCPTATKSAFGSEAEAAEKLDWIQRYGDEREKKPVRVYPCSCGKWHLTSIPAYATEVGERARAEA